MNPFPFVNRADAKNGQTETVPQEEYEAQMKEKQIKALRRRARQLGLEVIDKTSGSDATAAAAPVEG